MPELKKTLGSEKLRLELCKLEKEHARIDEILSNLNSPILDTLLIQRLKKEKLFLKDRIKQINNTLTPDIIA
tara:strand:- start:316 stop:531 length:216 start_codon:yes stop_codon:yes gene_type:complete